MSSPSNSITAPSEGEMHTLEHVDQYLAIGQESDASDIHLGVNAKPIWRRYGNLEPIWLQAPTLSAADTERLAMGFLTEPQKKLLADRGDVDFAYANSNGRFRTSVVRHRLGVDLVFRIIKTKVRRMDDLGLPQNLKLLTQYHNGLVLVTGSVGSGKSTTLAALVEEVNNSRHDHIITLEDPIEYLLESKGCHITQREVHTHTQSFAAALPGALRDLETIQLAITASETGHLVLGTLHTANAPRTLDRLLDVFPVNQRDQIRVMVSESLRGIISQQLIPRMDGSGRALAIEILVNTPAVAHTIREGKTFMLPGIIQTGRKLGMKLMDDSLTDLYDKQIISQEEAYTRAEQKGLMRMHFGR